MGEQLGTRRTIPDESTEWNPCSGMGETAVYLVLPRLCRSCTHPPHQEVEEDEAPYRLFIWATSDTIVAGCPNKYMIYVTLLLIYVVASIQNIWIHLRSGDGRQVRLLAGAHVDVKYVASAPYRCMYSSVTNLHP